MERLAQLLDWEVSHIVHTLQPSHNDCTVLCALAFPGAIESLWVVGGARSGIGRLFPCQWPAVSGGFVNASTGAGLCQRLADSTALTRPLH